MGGPGTVIALVAPRRRRSAIQAALGALGGVRAHWVLYEREDEIRERVRQLLARERVDGVYLGPMPYDRCRDVLPADLPVAITRPGAIELAVTLAGAMARGLPAAPVSIDTIDEQVVVEVAGALGLRGDLVASLPYATEQSVDDIVDFHLGHRRRTGSYAVTGRSEVERRLAGRMPLLRPVYVPSTARALLNELLLRVQSKQDSERTLAAGVFRIVPGTGARNVDQARAALVHVLMSTPEFADAWVENRGTAGVVVFAHKALLDRATRGWTMPPRIGTGPQHLDFHVAVGFGLGASARTCVLLAEQGAAHAEREGGGRAYLMGDRGLMVGPMLMESAPLEFSYREHGPGLERLARDVGLSPMTLSRLAALERRLADRPISPSELADALAITDPSARRLMRALALHGLATDAGTSQRLGKGRPSRLWHLAVGRQAGDRNGGGDGPAAATAVHIDGGGAEKEKGGIP